MEASAAEASNSADSSKSKLIKIKVKTLGQASYDLEVESDALIQDVKSQLARVSNTPANRQRLVFRGRVLKDDQLLSNYNVVEGSVIHMVTRPVDTSQQPPPPGPQEHMSAGGLGRFAANMMGPQGPGAPMDPNEFGSFLASILHQMGIQGAVHVTHTTVPSTTTGDASPEQVAQAVAEQISQQARQQMSEAGAEAPVPLLTALRNYLQRLDSMSQGDLSVRVFNLPPSGQAAGNNAVFNLQQFAAAAREFIGEWGGGDEVRDFIASSAQPGFGHWQPDAEAGTQRSPETTTTAAPDQGGQNGRATEAGEGREQAPAPAHPAPTSAAGEEGAAVQADEPTAERDPRRNGMDNPFGDGNPMHPSLALLTEIAVQQLLRETSTHVQAQLTRILRSATISQNIVDLHGPSQQDGLFSEEDLEGIARALHAEGTLLLETARAVSAYLLARRSNSATPLLNATAYHLRSDGSAPANTVPAALAGRRLTQERRNAIFLNGIPFVNGSPVGGGSAGGGPAAHGQASGRGGMPPGTRMTARRGGHHARPVGGGRGAASQGAAGTEHAQQVPSFAIPLGGHFQAIQAMVNGTSAIPVGGRMVRVNQEQTAQGNTVSVQIDNAQPVTLDIAPLVQAFERVFSNVPGIDQLFGQPAPAAAPGPPSPAAPQSTTNARGDCSTAAGTPVTSSTPDATPSPAATPETSAQRSTAQNLSAMLPGIMQQVIPIFVSMMAASGGQSAPANAATGPTSNQQQGGASGAQQFMIPGLSMGSDNQVTVDIQTILQGSGAAEALGPFLEGIMFSMNEAGFQAGFRDAGLSVQHGTSQQGGPPQDPRRRPQQAATRSHPVVDADEEDDVDEEDEDIPALMQSSDDGMSYDTEDDASHLSSRSDVSDEKEDDDEDDDDDESDGESKEGSEAGMPALVSDRDPFGELENHSAGWHTAEEDSADEAERHGGSPQGRRVRRRRDTPSPDQHAAAHGKATDKATQDQKDEGPSSSKAAGEAPSAAAAAGSIPVPSPATRDGPQSWPLSADNLDDSPASPADSPSSPAVAGLPPMPARAGRPPVGLGAGLALPARGGRGGRRGGRNGRSGTAGRGASVPLQSGSAAAGNGVPQVRDPRVPQASVPPSASSVRPTADSTPQTGVEEIRRQAGSGTGAPPDLEGILSRLLGAEGGQGVPRGSAATRSSPGPGGGGLMDILQSPALQQLTGQLFGPPPGARGSAAPVSGGPPAGPMGPGGGLMGIMSQLAQSPAMQQMAEQLSGQTEEGGSDQRASHRSRPREEGPPPDFGAFLQQMLPVMGQMLGGPPGAGVGGGPGSRSGAHAVEIGDEFASLNALPPAQASRWRQIIMADRVAQAEQVTTPLSSTYLAGSRGAHSAEQ